MTKYPSGSIMKKLEIAIVTCDRALFLDNTLRSLAESPFRNVRISIFDNCSTNTTDNICLKYAEIFPFLTVIRQERNIGEYANYLYAAESLSSEYGWILRDDDVLDFSSASQIIQAIESEAYDVLYVGSRAELIWDGAESCSVAQLATAKARVYLSFSHWPALIFRTSLFDEECIVKGYRMINNVCPTFPFINKLVERNASIYVSRQQLVIRRETNISEFTGLSRYAAWVNCCQTIKNRELRNQTIDDGEVKYNSIKKLAFWIVLDKVRDPSRFWTKIVDIVWGLSLWQRLKFLLFSPLMIIPIPRLWLKKIAEKIIQVDGEIRALRRK